jgi:hypothetical protein
VQCRSYSGGRSIALVCSVRIQHVL